MLEGRPGQGGADGPRRSFAPGERATEDHFARHRLATLLESIRGALGPADRLTRRAGPFKLG